MNKIYVGMIDNNKDNDDCLWNGIPYELQCKGEIECYDKIKELHPKYPVIIFNHILQYKQSLKKIVSWLM
ncbi:MAG TPA: hypothetical protein VFP49_00665 [Nitrososphaeraceae archaeon]|nr:hypothetical protein [Nitrososphaeraceae archaeon]